MSNGSIEFGPPKTRAGRRSVSIPSPIIPALEHHLSVYVDSQPDALVFLSPRGHPLRRTKFRSQWVKARAAAGVTDTLHFHDLRGSGATWAAHAGATVAELMARLGHESPNMAMRYQHATAEREKALAEKLGQLFFAASTTDGGSAALASEASA